MPRYSVPQVPEPPEYFEAASGQPIAWKAAQPNEAAARGRWWEVFQDRELNRLEEQVDVSNQSIAAAAANYAAARAVVRETRSLFYPTIGTSPSISQQGLSIVQGSSIGGPRSFTEYSLPAEASWEPDLWGKVRSSVRATQYAAQASAADLENVRLAVHGQVAMDYFSLRAQMSLKEVFEHAVRLDSDALEISRQMYNAGLGTDEAVALAESQLKAAQAADENTGISIAQYQHAIALLTGKEAAQMWVNASPLDARPPVVPAGIPADLLLRRPDIAAAERSVAAANAQIGVARSAYFPEITLSAAGGFAALTAADWFTWPSRVWAVGPSAVETIFDAGLRKATVQQYRAQYEVSIANYRQTSLTAFQQVEDALAAIHVLRGEVETQNAAVAAAERGYQEATVRYRAGLDPFLNVLTAEALMVSYQQTEVSLRSQEMNATVQLVESLGGGWDTGQLPDTKSVARVSTQ